VAFCFTPKTKRNHINTMSTQEDTYEFFNEMDDHDLDEKGRERFPRRNPKKLPQSEQVFLRKQDDSRGSFKFTYKAARFEEWWLLDSLGEFYEHQWVADVLSRVKGGKEASVYLCQAGSAIPEGGPVAAKVYRPRMLRNLKNDAIYREGRGDLDDEGNALFKDADVHAMEKRTAYGEGLRHTSWIAHEFTTLQILRAAGADVPEAYAMTKNAILMGYVGDFGVIAPALSEISLERHEVRPLFERVIRNIDIMLGANRIHGDLSAYNILYWDGDITLIDFPQVVAPDGNRNAFRIFERDVIRICDYFAKQGLHPNPRKLAADLWAAHGHQTRPEVDVRLLDAEDPKDRAIWQKQKSGR
jgi:RIO kinase 1